MQAIGGLLELFILAMAAAAMLYYGGLGVLTALQSAYYHARGSDDPVLRQYWGCGPRSAKR